MIRRAVLCVVLGLAGLAAPRRARAEPAPPPPGDAVALLPFDADKGLEIYGQPVASEIARALGAGDVQVVVVGPRTAVPDHTLLIIDGTITQGKASAVTISLRFRNGLDGVVIKPILVAIAPSLAKIDGAAADVAAQALPIVRERLPELRRAAAAGHGRVVEIRPAPAVDRPVLVAVADARKASDPGPLRGALEAAVASWTRAHHRVQHSVDPARLDAAQVARTVTAGGTDLSIGFWILGWTVEPPADAGKPAMARARVRVQVSNARAVVFDRVVATDTVLGDPGRGQPELAARVAREVLAILGPHMQRSVPSWR